MEKSYHSFSNTLLGYRKKDESYVSVYNSFTMPTNYDLTGRTALITGAGKRIGKAFALAISEFGGNVAIHYGRSADAAEETAEIARTHGVQAITLQADLRDEEAVQALVPKASKDLGTVHWLINNASVFEDLTASETDIEAWTAHLSINLTAPFILSQALISQLDAEPGAILNMLDWRALRPGADHFAYTISKAGLVALTKSSAQAYAPQVRVNGLALGAILPPPGASDYDPAIVEDVPAARWGSVEETVNAMLFLMAGPEFITGEIIHLDGGRHLV